VSPLEERFRQKEKKKKREEDMIKKSLPPICNPNFRPAFTLGLRAPKKLGANFEHFWLVVSALAPSY